MMKKILRMVCTKVIIMMIMKMTTMKSHISNMQSSNHISHLRSQCFELISRMEMPPLLEGVRRDKRRKANFHLLHHHLLLDRHVLLQRLWEGYTVMLHQWKLMMEETQQQMFHHGKKRWPVVHVQRRRLLQ